MKNEPTQSRREFIKKTSLIASSLAAIPFASKSEIFNTSVDDSIKVALVGCGGRGTGAAMQAMLSKQNVKLVAMADAFRDRLDDCYKALMSDDLSDWSGAAGNIKDKIAVPEENKFVGFDGYKKAIALVGHSPGAGEFAHLHRIGRQPFSARRAFNAGANCAGGRGI